MTQARGLLRAELADYSLGRTTLRRPLRAHPAHAGVEKLRAGKKSELRDLTGGRGRGRGLERDASTRADAVAELAAAGFREVEEHLSSEVAAAWSLPLADEPTRELVVRCRV